MQDLLSLIAAHGVLIVFASTLASRLGAPFPAGPVLVVAGGLSGVGQVSLAANLGAAVLANLLGDAAWYVAGRWRGQRVLKRLCQISLSPDTCVRQSEGILSRWGGGSLVAAKFLPGISVVAAPMAGALGMSWRRFLAWDLVAALLWSLVFLGAGRLFSRQIGRVLDLMATFGRVAVVAVVIALVLMTAARWLRRRWMRSERYAPRIKVTELRELIRRGEAPIVIDVRSSIAMLENDRRVPGAISATLAQLPATAAALPRDREIVIYCNCPNEVSALRGARLLGKHGIHRAWALVGGLDAWIAIDSASPLPVFAGADDVAGGLFSSGDPGGAR